MASTHLSDIGTELAASVAEYFRQPFFMIFDAINQIAKLIQESKLYHATFSVENAAFLLLVSGLVFGEKVVADLTYYASTDHFLTALIGFFNQMYDTKYDIGMIAFFDHNSPRKLARWVAAASRLLTRTNVGLIASAIAVMTTFFGRVASPDMILVYPGSFVQKRWLKLVVKRSHKWELADQVRLYNSRANYVFTITQITNVDDKAVVVGNMEADVPETVFIGGFFRMGYAENLLKISQ